MPEPVQTSDRRLCLLLAVLTAAKLGFLVAYAFRSRWVMDEFAQAHSARYLDQGLYSAIDPIKTALPLLAFRIPLELSDSATQILIWWRIEMLIAALAIIALTCTAAARLRRDTVSILLTAFVLLSFSTFIERAFRVRNDTFAVVFGVAGLLALVTDWRPSSRAWGTGILAGLAFLCTQKAVYLALPLGIGLLVREWRADRVRQVAGSMLRFSGGVAGTILIYAIGFGGVEFLGVFRQVFLSPLRSSLLSSEVVGGVGQFVGQTLARNPIAYSLCATGAVVAGLRWNTLRQRERAAMVVTLLVTFAVFRHPQPWPYVFIMALPLLALWAPSSLQLASSPRRGPWICVLVMLLSFSFVRNLYYLQDYNSTQFEVVRQAESFLRPGDRYFDAIGMVPSREIAGNHPWWWWDRPTRVLLRRNWDNGERSVIEDILSDQPKVWILNYRFRSPSDMLDPVWELGTVRVSPHLRLSGRQLNAGYYQEFHNLWPGLYALYDQDGAQVDGRLMMDGESCALPCDIRADVHRVKVDRDAFLLPMDFRPLGPLPSPQAGFDLFQLIYTF